MFQDVKKQSRVKRKELNKLLGYTVRHLKDKVSSHFVIVVIYVPDSGHDFGNNCTCWDVDDEVIWTGLVVT